MRREFAGHGAAAARGRPRGDARRGLQPHRRGGPAGSDLLVPRHRQRVLLPPRRARPVRRHDRMRQHARLRPRPRRSGSCSTRCGTSPRSCRSTASASTSPPRSAATTTAATRPSIRCCGRCSRTRCSATAKLIAEPWDVGPGGWQTGNFPAGLLGVERPLPRPDARLLARRPAPRARRRAPAGSGIGRFATPPRRARRTRFSLERGPLASLNFVTAHDGFTARRPHGLRREAQPRQRRAQPRRHRRQQLLQPRGRGRDRRSRRSARRGGAASGTCSAPCCCRPACRCSPPATSSAAASAATTTRTATTPT